MKVRSISLFVQVSIPLGYPSLQNRIKIKFHTLHLHIFHNLHVYIYTLHLYNRHIARWWMATLLIAQLIFVFIILSFVIIHFIGGTDQGIDRWMWHEDQIMIL